MKATTKNSFKMDVLDSKVPVLVDVWAPWCGPCRGMEPVLHELEKDITGWAEIAKINADEEMELAQELGVSGLPTFLIYKDGKSVGQMVGVTSKVKLLEGLQKAK